MPSIVRKIKEKYILTRRGAYVTKRPDAETRVAALPPPKKKNGIKVVDKKVVIEKKQVDTKYESDDEESLLDEKTLEAGDSKRASKIIRRSAGDWDEKEGVVSKRYRTRRQVVKSGVYREEVDVEVRTQTKSWWTRTMTACMPSET